MLRDSLISIAKYSGHVLMSSVNCQDRNAYIHAEYKILRNSNIIHERCRPIQKGDLGVFIFIELIRKLTIEFLCLKFRDPTEQHPFHSSFSGVEYLGCLFSDY